MTDKSRRIALGPADEFPFGMCRLFTIGAREVGVIRLPSGTFRAVLNRCPHKAAPICKGIIGGTWPPSAPGDLQFGREGEVLVCPWHGREFDLRTGEELYQKRPTRLRLLPIEVDDGTVIVSAAALDGSVAEPA
jgi:nitrite reductase (NADH) small subunit